MPLRDLTGHKFGHWTVLEELGSGMVRVQCDCEAKTVKVIQKKTVVSRVSTSCGCSRARSTKVGYATKFEDLTGQKLNHWTILKELGGGKVECECDCENHTRKILYKKHIKSGASKSCGCKVSNVGKKFNHWTVLEEYKDGKIKAQCDCEAGTIKILTLSAVTSGNSKSCGCMKGINSKETMTRRYGETCPSRASNPRQGWQIRALESQENMLGALRKFENANGRKPTIQDIEKLLDIQTSAALKYVHKYGLEDNVQWLDMTSNEEEEIAREVESFSKCKVSRHIRDLIPPYELDIYIPDKRIAIEFNGSFWHSVECKGRDYHRNKTEMCEEKGIRLIHIFEHEWVEAPERISAYLYTLISGKEGREEIPLKSCEIKGIGDSASLSFERAYNIFGETQHDISIAVCHEGSILGQMTFKRIESKVYEISSCCEHPQAYVDGWMKVVLDFFILKMSPSMISCKVDLSKSYGEEYARLGFKAIEEIEPSYRIVNRNTQREVKNREANSNDIVIYDCGYRTFRFRA